jgi:hypothetical protein
MLRPFLRDSRSRLNTGAHDEGPAGSGPDQICRSQRGHDQRPCSDRLGPDLVATLDGDQRGCSAAGSGLTTTVPAAHAAAAVPVVHRGQHEKEQPVRRWPATASH